MNKHIKYVVVIVVILVSNICYSQKLDFFSGNIVEHTVFFEKDSLMIKAWFERTSGILNMNNPLFQYVTSVRYYDKEKLYKKTRKNIFNSIVLEEIYYSDGSLKNIGYSIEGTNIGLWNYYNNKGELIKIKNYEENRTPQFKEFYTYISKKGFVETYSLDMKQRIKGWQLPYIYDINYYEKEGRCQTSLKFSEISGWIVLRATTFVPFFDVQGYYMYVEDSVSEFFENIIYSDKRIVYDIIRNYETKTLQKLNVSITDYYHEYIEDKVTPLFNMYDLNIFRNNDTVSENVIRKLAYNTYETDNDSIIETTIINNYNSISLNISRYKRGGVKSIGYCIDGVKLGKWCFYNKEGRLVEKIDFLETVKFEEFYLKVYNKGCFGSAIIQYSDNKLRCSKVRYHDFLTPLIHTYTLTESDTLGYEKYHDLFLKRSPYKYNIR